MDFEGNYEIRTEDEKLELRTTSFKADRGSVLHSGIFNKELAASFIAAIVIISYLFVTALFRELQLIHYMIAAIIFVIIFPLSRVYLFKEPVLVTVIDKGSGTACLTVKRPFGSRNVQKPLGSLTDIRVDYRRIEPENPDGIAIVEKIALQHGTVIPGFGEVKEFFNVILNFGGEQYIVFTTSVESEARAATEQLKRFIG